MAPMPTRENVDILVIGTGWNGLCAAKTYHQCHPDARMVILDDQPTIGGVWAKHRLYPGLKTNNMRGNYEFGDFTYEDAGLDVKQGHHILGHEVHEYLNQYAKHFGIMDNIRFNTQVTTLEHLQGGKDGNGSTVRWLATTTNKLNGDQVDIGASKVILSTGLTSDAFVPKLPGEDRFEAPILHVKDLQERSSDLFKSCRRVTVLGGTKSAWDASYAFASAGIPVDWVIRKSGHGPVWMSPAYFNKSWNLLLERLVHMRLVSFFSPCVWGTADGYGWIRSFLHKTRLGRWLTAKYWRSMQNRLVRTNRYEENEEVHKLKPWVDIFWIAGSLSILNYQTDFFDYVRNGMIKVHIADISGLDKNQVTLSNGEMVPSDALICSTGWRHRPSINFLPAGIDVSLGIPHSKAPKYPKLTAQADEFLLRSFPALRQQPALNPHYQSMEGSNPAEALNEPYRLYRFMVPPEFYLERSIAFAGVVQSISTIYIAQAQAVWITAYFGGHSAAPLVQLQNDKDKLLDKVRWEAVLHTQYGKWRCPGGYGSRFPDFVYDGVPYIDLLLKDVGLRHKRKSGFFKELREPYLTSDYGTIVDEWLKLSHE